MGTLTAAARVASTVSGAGNSAGASTWATRPSAAAFAVGTGWFITDIPSGGAGTLFHSDGTRWCRLAPSFIAGSAVAVAAHTGTLSETVLASFTLPGGLLGPNGTLDVESMWAVNNNANIKIVRTYLGASVMHSVSPASGTYIGMQTSIANRNAQNAQRGCAVNLFGVPFAGGNSLATATINTSADQTVGLRAQLANVGDSMVLESWRAVFTSRG